jgi:hypothetical protein
MACRKGEEENDTNDAIGAHSGSCREDESCLRTRTASNLARREGLETHILCLRG